MITEPLECSQPLNHPERYGSPAIAFHWVMFVLVGTVGVLGLLHDSWPEKTQGFWINVHAMGGLLLWVLLCARLVAHSPCPSAATGECRRVVAPPLEPSAFRTVCPCS